MARNDNAAQRFPQLRAQVARKKELETARAALTAQCAALSVQAQEKKTARQQAERELEQLESGGAMGVLFTLAGGKAARQEAARQELRRAKEEDQKAAWDLAEAQGQLLETEREQASLEGCEAAFAQARRERIAALRAAGLPQSEVLEQLEAELAQGKRQIQELTDLGSQCQAAQEQAEHTLHLAERMEFVQTVSSIYTLQDAAQLTIQRQQEVAQRLQELTAGLEAAQARLNALLDDLLSQDICQ